VPPKAGTPRFGPAWALAAGLRGAPAAARGAEEPEDEVDGEEPEDEVDGEDWVTA
jgi:hypothetical protein